MKFRKCARLLLSAVLLLAFVPFSRAETAPDRGQELFDIFLKLLSPERAILQLYRPPSEDGTLPWGYLECKNANVRGMNVQSLKLDCFDAKITPPAQWKDVAHPKVTDMLACHAEGMFTEKDVNDFLESRLFGHDKEWERVHVQMTGGRICATAYYRLNLKLFRMKIKTEVSCTIEGRETALYLNDIQLKVNNLEVSPGLLEKALRKLQPFVDMKKYGLPLHLSKVEISEGVCRVRSRILPKPLTRGLLWEYPGGNNPTVFGGKTL